MRNALVILVLSLSPVLAQAAPITGWMVHNDTGTGPASIDNTAPNTPVITNTPNGNSNTLMAPFSGVTLVNDGDFVEVKTTLTMTTRTANTGTTGLNTQLRLGLFDSSNSSLTASDAPDLGFITIYSSVGTQAALSEQTVATQTSPFTSPTVINNATPPSGQISGANPGAVTFDLKATRDNGKLDLVGSIVDGGYEEDFSTTGYVSTNFPLNGSFSFNRIGLFLGGQVAATSSTLSNSAVLTNTPEPASFALLAGLGGLLATNRRRRQSAR